MAGKNDFAQFAEEVERELTPSWMDDQHASAERAIVGSILLDERCLHDIRQSIEPDMFFNMGLRTAYKISCEMQDEGEHIDPVTLGARIIEGGHEWSNAFAIQLMDETVTAANATAYCDVLKRESERRDLLRVLNAQRQALLSGSDPEDVRMDLATYIENKNLDSVKKGLVTSEEAAGAFLQNVIEAQEGRREPALRTGYKYLDEMLAGGLQRNGFYVLAARPGRGKTAFALNIAYRVASHGKRVLFISLEMDRDQLISRIVASKVGGLGPAQILNGLFSRQETMDKVVESTRQVSKLPIFYNRADRLNVQEIKHLTRMSKADLVVIDYLGLVDYENENGKPYEEVTKISRKLKLLAKSTGSPILCLAQLNRESEKRKDGRPILSDLRETGAIEQDADGVLFNFPAKQDDLKSDWNGTTTALTVIVEKNRHGATGDVEMNWYKKEGRIVEARSQTW